ncbi:putative quinol monooxygenase [Pseudomonas pergaminensis]|jgi:quinol monooxygenase YgiN
MLIIAVTFVLHKEHLASFLDEVLQNAKTSLDSEPGCIRFDVCENSQECEVFLYEQYVDDHAFDEIHLKSSHFLDFNEITAPWIAKKSMHRYQLRSEKLAE